MERRVKEGRVSDIMDGTFPARQSTYMIGTGRSIKENIDVDSEHQSALVDLLG